jgi:ubiquinone/menaquinone biosynthesis C-methylase UbiE
VSFEVSGDAYAQFMGRFSMPLARLFAEHVGVVPGQTALDVGCGTGALTQVLVQRLGARRVCGTDPSESFLAVMRERLPEVEVRRGRAEELPFEDDRFDVVLAQLVVHFMTNAVRGLREMARVARPGGLVAANVWDHAGSWGALAVFWDAARTDDPNVIDESHLPGVRQGHLEELFSTAGFADVTATTLTVEVPHESFEAWWHPFTLGVGPAGAYVAGLDAGAREALRNRCRALLPDDAGVTRASAWTVVARVPTTPG